MQPAYYEDFTEIKKKIWSMLDDAVTNRSSQFRIPTFICGHNNDIDGRIVVLRKSDQQNNLVQFHSDIRSDKIELLKNNIDSESDINIDFNETNVKFSLENITLICRLIDGKYPNFGSNIPYQ